MKQRSPAHERGAGTKTEGHGQNSTRSRDTLLAEWQREEMAWGRPLSATATKVLVLVVGFVNVKLGYASVSRDHLATLLHRSPRVVTRALVEVLGHPRAPLRRELRGQHAVPRYYPTPALIEVAVFTRTLGQRRRAASPLNAEPGVTPDDTPKAPGVTFSGDSGVTPDVTENTGNVNTGKETVNTGSVPSSELRSSHSTDTPQPPNGGEGPVGRTDTIERANGRRPRRLEGPDPEWFEVFVAVWEHGAGKGSAAKGTKGRRELRRAMIPLLDGGADPRDVAVSLGHYFEARGGFDGDAPEARFIRPADFALKWATFECSCKGKGKLALGHAPLVAFGWWDPGVEDEAPRPEDERWTPKLAALRTKPSVDVIDAWARKVDQDEQDDTPL